MIGKTLAHYRVLRLLGEGGMGVVYEAEDTRLKRRVALKVLSERVTGHPHLLARFQREAEALATLNHPNIVTIHSVETAGDVPFMTMELVEGKPLNEVTPADGMDLDAFFTLALPLAEALSTAHEMGITHRDLKPANILIDNEGRPKVLDFGLAKLTVETDPEDRTLAMSHPLTEAGSIVGTAPYMSPEQLENKTVDARSDIFSLGIVMYEMLTGTRPFTGDSSVAVMSSVLKDTPRRMTDLKVDLPRHLDRIVSGCLEKNPEDRPQTAKGVRNSLRSLHKDLDTDALLESGSRPAPPLRHAPAWRTPVLVAAAVLVVGFGSWLLFGRDRAPETSTAAAEVAVRQDERKMIAVLPFDNLGDSQDEYFADGLTEEITSRLASIKGLGVISRTSAMQYKGRNISLQDIGRELGVDYVLEGTVRWQRSEGAPSRIRVTPQLIRVSDDTHLWASRYDRQLEEIFEVQSDIAEAVAGELNITLLEPEKAALAVRPTENMEAYQIFLRGKEIWIRPGYDAEAFRQAAGLFRQATDLDPDYLEAWTELSSVYLMLHMGGDGSRETLELAGQTLARAEAIDPDHPLVVVARGYYHYLGHLDYERALAEFRRAEVLVPNDPSVPEGMAYILRRQGNLDESTAKLYRALELDPNNAHLHLQLARNYDADNEYALADAAYERSIALYPDGIEAYLEKAANAFRWHGSPGEALAIIDRTPRGDNTAVIQSRVGFLMRSRDYDAAAAALATMSPADFDGPPDLINYYMAVMGLARVQGDVETARAAATAGQAVALASVAEQTQAAIPFTSLAVFEAVLGQREAALDHLRIGMERGQTDRFFYCAAISLAPTVHLALGDCETAIDLLGETLDTGCLWRLHRNDLRLDPLWDPCRNDPGFQELLKDGGPDS